MLKKNNRKFFRPSVIPTLWSSQMGDSSVFNKNLRCHNQEGELNPNWKGGVHVNPQGYRKIRVPNHPFCDGKKYVMEHRLVMEKYLDRYLGKSEEVHHLNGNKQDNRLENLELLTIGEHTVIHTKIRAKAGIYKTRIYRFFSSTY